LCAAPGGAGGDLVTPSLSIVAFGAESPMSPRGERALAVADAAAQIAEVDLVTPTRAAGFRGRVRPLAHVAAPLLLDRWEPEAWWILHQRRTRPDGALLVGFPYSPVYWAAHWLVRQGIRYVVDLGDPWALTLPRNVSPTMGGLRAARCEHFVWRFASGGVVTTDLQACALRRLFPALPVVVRPNGYRPVRPVTARPNGYRPGPWTARRGAPPTSRTLRLVHYGNLYDSRLDIVPLLSRLTASGAWDSVIFTLHGHDWTDTLKGLGSAVRVHVRRELPWDDIVISATDHDLAVVVGNDNPAQLPSKAVQYLTLPIPRLAVVGGDPADALAAYVRDKPGWMTLRWDAPEDSVCSAVAGHIARAWSPEQLAPPAGESWDEVAPILVDVLRACVLEAPAHRPAAGSHTPAVAIAAANSSHPR
jgi:hypothetical protein